MRFLFVDRILELERGKRILATKTITAMDPYLTAHYPRLQVVPTTLIIECLAQTGGWLNLISKDFSVKTVLAVCEGVRIRRHVWPGDTLLLEARMLRAHSDGATVYGEARVGSEVVATMERLVLAHEVCTEVAFIQQQRERLQYVNSGIVLADAY